MATWSVFKFGGASVKDAVALRNAIKVVREHGQSPLVIVVSAMGKTTNALEAYLQQREQGFDAEAAKGLEAVMAYHAGIAQEVGIWTDALEAAVQAEWQRIAALDASAPYGQRYDTTVSAGEVVSSLIFPSGPPVWRPRSRLGGRPQSSEDQCGPPPCDRGLGGYRIRHRTGVARRWHLCHAGLHRLGPQGPNHDLGPRRLRLFGGHFCLCLACGRTHYLEGCAGRTQWRSKGLRRRGAFARNPIHRSH